MKELNNGSESISFRSSPEMILQRIAQQLEEDESSETNLLELFQQEGYRIGEIGYLVSDICMERPSSYKFD